MSNVEGLPRHLWDQTASRPSEAGRVIRMTQAQAARLIDGPDLVVQAAILHQPPSNPVVLSAKEDLFVERCRRHQGFPPVLAALAFFLGSASAGAQSLPQANTWTVTQFLHTSMGMGDPAPEDSMGPGAGVSSDWTRNIGFEGDVGHHFDVAGDDAAIDWSVTTFSANALYHVNTQYVTRYATLGLASSEAASR